MEESVDMQKSPFLLVAGIKGAIGSTLAVVLQTLHQNPDRVLPYLMTPQNSALLGDPTRIELAGWDCSEKILSQSVKQPQNMH